jgi:hypothetical protein
MSKHIQIYYTAIFGALGGLFGWWVIGSFATQSWNAWLAAGFVGAGLGMFISGMIAATDGALIKRVPLRALRDGLRGALAGALMGALALIVAQQGLFLLLQGGLLGRTLGWMVLGLLIGLSDYAVSRRRQRSSYAALGGMAGGLVGGLIYEALTQVFLAQSGAAQVFLGGLGLVLLGACIGGLIPLARQVLSRGELRVLMGEQRGLVREVTDTATIGRYDGNDLYLPDSGVEWRHAVVRRTAGGFELSVLPAAEYAVFVGAQPIAPGSMQPLTNGDQIRIGEAVVQFVGR